MLSLSQIFPFRYVHIKSAIFISCTEPMQCVKNINECRSGGKVSGLEYRTKIIFCCKGFREILILMFLPPATLACPLTSRKQKWSIGRWWMKPFTVFLEAAKSRDLICVKFDFNSVSGSMRAASRKFYPRRRKKKAKLKQLIVSSWLKDYRNCFKPQVLSDASRLPLEFYSSSLMPLASTVLIRKR